MSLNQLSMLLGLPDSDLKQVLDYALTLSKAEAADHFKSILGDGPQAIEFISAFNSRRQDPANKPGLLTNQQGSANTNAVPKSQKRPTKKKAPIHIPAPRPVTNQGPTPGQAYSKKAFEDDYMSGRSGSATPSSSNAVSRATTPNPPKSSKPPPSAAGSLISDLLGPKSKSKSNPTSRSSTPGPSSKNNAPTAKISITGGTPMHGASTAVSDLDAAIRSLEITTNPYLSNADRKCNCVATRHPLQTAAPNCLKCGKVICVKEGLGPCTYCGAPVLSPSEVQAMISELKAERGREKMAANREANKRADVAKTPRPFTKPRGEGGDDIGAAEAKALEHRDRLLNFQAQNAQRTTVRDEAADFDVSKALGMAGNMWASPEERARELKRQQKILREMEWNARPDYEKRTQVVSIDLVGGKVVKKMMAVKRPPTPEEEPNYRYDDSTGVLAETNANRRIDHTGGKFSRNPLLRGMIKPVYDAKGKGAALERRKDSATTWRRVQDNMDDNEAVILDGGIYGGREAVSANAVAGDKPACG